MTENYFYPDTDEMMEIYDTLEDLLAKGKFTQIRLPITCSRFYLHRLMSGAVISSFGVRDPISIS